MALIKYLRTQIKLHPSMQPQDTVKLCFQAAFGAEHLLMNIGAAREYFMREYESVPESNCALSEQISPKYCRVNLAACKRERLSSEQVFEMFRKTALRGADKNANAAFARYIKDAEVLARRGETPFSLAELMALWNVYDLTVPKPVHHSDEYRRREHPAYRIVSVDIFNA